ncbi:MAG: efflux RND transporter periplasmic adaptor subunit, partial [Kofleriaceae bacterium]
EAAAADAEARSLEVQLGSYVIVSPIAGTVVDKLVEVGEGVAPGFGTPGVVEVVDMESLVVEVDVPEGKLDQVGEGNPAEIILDAYPSTRFGGHVKEIGRRVNRAKATVPVKIAFDDLSEAGGGGSIAPETGAGSGAGSAEPVKKRRVLPEMAARVSFLEKAVSAEERKAPPKLVVPANAIVQRAGADVIFIVDEDRVRMTTVKVGPPFAGGRELETPLPVGTKVVLDPPADLTDGKKVKEKT